MRGLQAPPPNADTLALAREFNSLPASYERKRWPTHLVDALKRGVKAEVRRSRARVPGGPWACDWGALAGGGVEAEVRRHGACVL